MQKHNNSRGVNIMDLEDHGINDEALNKNIYVVCNF